MKNTHTHTGASVCLLPCVRCFAFLHYRFSGTPQGCCFCCCFPGLYQSMSRVIILINQSNIKISRARRNRLLGRLKGIKGEIMSSDTPIACVGGPGCFCRFQSMNLWVATTKIIGSLRENIKHKPKTTGALSMGTRRTYTSRFEESFNPNVFCVTYCNALVIFVCFFYLYFTKGGELRILSAACMTKGTNEPGSLVFGGFADIRRTNRECRKSK